MTCELYRHSSKTCTTMHELPKAIGEIKVTVPWGYIAAKTWGDEKDPLVLCYHGIMDNAGSFDRLINLLPNSFYYVGVDLPGHGRSSHFPPNLPIHTLDYLLVYHLMSKHFGDRKCIILGHSYGGQIGYLYAQLYPECVERLIMLDTVATFPVSAKHFKDYLVEKIHCHLETVNKLKTRQQPTYTYEEALQRLQLGRRYATIREEAALALLDRSVKETSDGRFKFTIDQRLKGYINPVRDFRYTIETMKAHPVHCPVLVVLAKQNEAQQVFMSSVIRQLKRSKNVLIKIVEGNHDVHNDSPEFVAPYLVKFLLMQKPKL